MSLRILFSVFILIISCFSFNFEVRAGSCQWSVQGSVNVIDDLFSQPKVKKSLKHARVKVWASTVSLGGWAYWGSDVIHSNGSYQVSATPRQSDPWGCNLRRRFKVKVYFENSKVKIANAAYVTHSTLISNPQRRFSGRNVVINKIFSNLKDSQRARLSGSYVDTRAAQLFVGYQEIYKHMRYDLDLAHHKIKAVWPDGAGTTGYKRMWSPPGGYVRIPKAEFWRYDSEQRNWTYSTPLSYQRKDLIHEMLHQWFNQNIYVPSFLSGYSLGTHEFLESPELSLYESMAEVLARALYEGLFDDGSYSNLKIYNLNMMRYVFANAKDTFNRPYYTASELEHMMSQNSEEWLYQLDRAEFSVTQYLNRLLMPLNIPGYAVTSEALFTPGELMQALLQWKTETRGLSVPFSERSLRGLYEFLADLYPDFAEMEPVLLQSANPHYL